MCDDLSSTHMGCQQRPKNTCQRKHCICTIRRDHWHQLSLLFKSEIDASDPISFSCQSLVVRDISMKDIDLFYFTSFIRENISKQKRRNDCYRWKTLLRDRSRANVSNALVLFSHRIKMHSPHISHQKWTKQVHIERSRTTAQQASIEIEDHTRPPMVEWRKQRPVDWRLLIQSRLRASSKSCCGLDDDERVQWQEAWYGMQSDKRSGKQRPSSSTLWRKRTMIRHGNRLVDHHIHWYMVLTSERNMVSAMKSTDITHVWSWLARLDAGAMLDTHYSGVCRLSRREETRKRRCRNTLSRYRAIGIGSPKRWDQWEVQRAWKTKQCSMIVFNVPGSVLIPRWCFIRSFEKCNKLVGRKNRSPV